MENELNDIENEEKELAKKMQELKKKKKELKPKDNDKLLYWICGGVGIILLALIVGLSFINAGNVSDPITVEPSENSKITFKLPNNYYLDKDGGCFYKVEEDNILQVAGNYSYYAITDSDDDSTAYDDLLESLADYEVTRATDNDNVAYFTVSGDDYLYYIYLINDETNSGYVLQLNLLNTTQEEGQAIIGSLAYSE